MTRLESFCAHLTKLIVLRTDAHPLHTRTENIAAAQKVAELEVREFVSAAVASLENPDMDLEEGEAMRWLDEPG
jgi:hypothetical protein